MTEEEKNRHREILELADEQIAWCDGELERDNLNEFDAAWPLLVSEGDDNGAYVRAWVRVDFSGTKFDKEIEEQEE